MTLQDSSHLFYPPCINACPTMTLCPTMSTFKVHTADQIQAVRDSLPSLGPLTRAMKIHEIYITADGVVKRKNLPTNLYYDNVKITESRRYKRVE